MQKRLAYGLAVLPCVVGVAACGGSGGAPGVASGSVSASGTAARMSPQKSVSAAYQATIQAGTADVSEALTSGSGRPAGETGQGQLRFSPPETDMTFRAGGTSNETRAIGGRVYLRLGAGRWSVVNTSQATGNDAAQQTSPLLSLSFLRGAADVRPAADAAIAGATDRGYRLTVDLAKVAAVQPTEADRRTVQGLSGLISQPLTMLVWLDAGGRVARIRQTVTVRAAAGRPAVTTTTTTTLSRYGTAVSITAPPSPVAATSGAAVSSH